MPVATFPLGPLQTNSYLIHSGTQAVAVDVGGDPDPMLEYLATHGLKLAAICITHRHFDHVYGVAALQKATGAPVYISADDDCLEGTESAQGGLWGFPTVTPYQSQPIALGKTSFGGMECEVLATPGHTPGGVSLFFPTEKLVLQVMHFFIAPLAARTFPAATTTACCAR